MRRASRVPAGLRKEVQALLPTWLGCGAAVGLAGLLDSSLAFTMGVLAYVFGSVSLGALSIGHEYGNRTLTLLLTLPADRRRLYLVKAAVLVPMQLALSAIAAVLLFAPRVLDGRFPSAATTILPILCSLLLAPWLTMICRNPLAGGVFSIAIPGMLHVIGDVIGVAMYELGSPRADRLALAVFWWGLAGLCAIASISSWRMFMRLEAIEGRDREFHFPVWRSDLMDAATRDRTARRPQPLWLLAKKEIRLQQMTFAVSGLYLVGWTAMSWLHVTGGRELPPRGVLTLLHGVLISLLIGSLASAEERHLGTLESQVLLPLATWKQWAVKAGMAMGLALLLAVCLPTVLVFLNPAANDVLLNGWFAATVIALTAGSLYVSTLSPSGVRALVFCLPVMLLAMALLRFVIDGVEWILRALGTAPQRHNMPAELTFWLSAGLGGGLLALVLWLAMLNHRSSDRSIGRVWRQAMWLAGLVIGVSVVSVVLAF